MAVGRGSMERAAKAAGGDTAKKAGDKAQAPVRRLTISEIVGEPGYVEPPRTARPPVNKPVSGGGGVKPSPVNKAEPVARPPVAEKPVQAVKQGPETRPSPAAGKTPAVLEKEAEGEIVYQKSSGMLERAAEPNERFGLGDAMPVYYF